MRFGFSSCSPQKTLCKDGWAYRNATDPDETSRIILLCTEQRHCFSVLGSVGLHICIRMFDHPRVGFFGGVILHTLDLPPTQDAIVANKVKGLAWNPYSKRNNPGGDWLGGRCNAYPTCSLLNIQERISIFNLYPWQMTTWFHVSCSHPWPGHSDECLAQSTTTRAVRTQQVWRPSL